MWIACSVSAVGFVAVKTVPSIAALYGWSIGFLRWPFVALVEGARGDPIPPPARIDVVLDTTDLMALACVLLAFAYLKPRSRMLQHSSPD